MRHGNFTLTTTLSRSSITANTIVIITANTGPIPPTDEVGIDEAIAEEALVEDPVEVDSGMEPDINKGSSWTGTVAAFLLVDYRSYLLKLAVSSYAPLALQPYFNNTVP